MSPVPVPLPTRVFLACGVTDMRKGFDGLAVLVQQALAQNPHSGDRHDAARRPRKVE